MKATSVSFFFKEMIIKQEIAKVINKVRLEKVFDEFFLLTSVTIAFYIFEQNLVSIHIDKPNSQKSTG